MELLLLVTIVCIVFFFVLKKRPGSRENPIHVNATTNPELYKPDIIEDSSHLKADLAATKEALSHVQQQLGRVNFEYQQIFTQLQTTCASYEQLNKDYDKLQFQSKSSQVKTGQITEQVAVLLPQFPCPLHTVKFFGSPIDFISIDLEAEKITFIEIKTGSSALSERQRKIRKMIQEKKIEFAEVRIDGKDVTVKKS